METPIFISYRRADSGPQAGRLYSALTQKFGQENVFMDTSDIEPGELWPRELDDALRSANSLLVVIGPDWLKASNEWGERRIDQENDWVRREIETTIVDGKGILPVLVRDARLPPPDKIPGSISYLTKRQKVDLREAYWDHDVHLVLARFQPQDVGQRPSTSEDSENPYPREVPPEKPHPISEEALKIALQGTLFSWKKIASPLPEDTSKVRDELVRSYKFKRFLDAVAFMSQVAPGCEIFMHHPRWENIWKTVTVYLSTWDIGQKISDRDIQLAKYLDRAFSEFPGAAEK